MATNKNKAVAVRLSLNSTQFLTGLNASKGAMGRFAGNVKSMATGIVTSLGFMGAYVGKKLVDEFVSFEFEMAKVKATTGATKEEFNSLLESAKKLGATTQFTAQEVADLQYRLSKLGFKTNDINNMTGSILDMALALGEDLGETTTTVAETMRIFGTQANDITTVTDQLATAFTNSGLSLENFGEAVKYVGPVANASGSNLNEMTSMLGILANNGIKASIAGTSLRKMFSVAAKEGRNLVDMLGDINGATNKNKVAFELFGRTAMSSAVILSSSAWEVGKLQHEMEMSAGKTEAMRKIMDSTAKGSLKRLTSAFSALSIQVGGAVMNALQPLVQWLTAFASSVDTRLIGAILSFIAILVGSSGLIMVLGSVGKGFKIAYDGVKLFGVGMVNMVKNLVKTTSTMIIAMGPIGWAIAGVVAVIAAISVALANGNETVKKYTLSFINGFIELYNKSTLFRVSVEMVVFAFKTLWAQAKMTFNNLIDGFSAVGNAIWYALQGKWTEAKDALSSGWTDIKDNAKKAGEEIAEAYKKGIENVKNGSLEKWTMEDLDKAIDTVKAGVSGVVDSVKSAIGNAYDSILNKFGLGGGGGIGKDWELGAYGGAIKQKSKGISPEDDERIRNSKPKGVAVPQKKNGFLSFLFTDEFKVKAQEFVQNWGSSVNAVKDIFGSMFEFISQKYDQQIDKIAEVADAKVDAVSKEYLSEDDKAKKIKKIREQQEKDEAKIKLKQWRANKANSISQIIMSGAMAVAQAFAQTGPGGFIIGPLVAASVAAQLAVAASAKPPKFADGGIVSGRTLAEVGEYSGVRSNPEVIAPLDKLKGMLGSGRQVIYVTGEFRQRGGDLVAVIDEYGQRQNRY